MRGKSQVRDAVVQGAIEFIREHASEKVSAAEVAARAGYSARRFRTIFREATGKGLARYIASVRLERAAKLLAEEGLPVSRVARECGYDDPNRFSTAFRHAYGKPPSRYQADFWKGSLPRGPRAVITEDFDTSFPGKQWEMRGGTWRAERRSLSNEDLYSYEAVLKVDLPENFIAEFEVLLHALPGTRVAQAEFSLGTAPGKVAYRVLLEPAPAPSSIMEEGLRVAFAERGFTAGRRHAVSVSFTRRRYAVAVDGHEILVYEPLLPLAYERRRYLCLAGYCARVSFRRLRVYVLPAGRDDDTESIADGYYTAGFFAEAARGYESITGKEDTAARTSLKAAACYRALGALDLARARYRRVLDVAPGSRRATLAALQLSRLSSDEETARLLREYVESPEHRETAVLFAYRELNHAMTGGHFDTVRAIAGALSDQEEHLPWPVRAKLIDAAVESGRLEEAARAAERPYPRETGDVRDAVSLLVNAAYVRTLLGQEEKANEHRARAEAISKDRFARAWVLASRALAARIEGNEAAAEKLLREVIALDTPHKGYAQTMRACLFISCGDEKRARSAVGKMTRLQPAPMLEAYIAIAGEDFTEAVARLEEDHERCAASVQREGVRRTQLLAGILERVRGQEGASRERLLPLVGKLPRTSRESLAARFYLGEEPRSALDEALRRIPGMGDAYPRALFQYVEGLRLEREGRTEEAAEYFRRAVKTDPSRFWPAVLAEKRLARYGRTTKRAR